MHGVGGSSPRLRGTPLNRGSSAFPERFIPASAGNSYGRGSRRERGSVHPRVCGELAICAPACMAVCGSSPRLRGTREARAGTRRRRRFIPASAGNSSASRFRTARRSVHPRVCGELTARCHTCGYKTGSSPRLRGTRRGQTRDLEEERFIPASAGNSPAGENQKAREAVHPRVCGELPNAAGASDTTDGSSPRLRGTHRRPGGARQVQRFIPASAGNSSSP